MEPWDVVPSVDNGPFAIETVLGRVINGPLNNETADREISNYALNIKSNFIRADQELKNVVLQQYNHDFS